MSKSWEELWLGLLSHFQIVKPRPKSLRHMWVSDVMLLRWLSSLGCMECGSLMLTSHMPQTEINETAIVFIVSSRLAVYFLAKYFLPRKSKHFLGSTYFLEKIWQKIIGILCWPLLDFMTLNSIRLALSQEGTSNSRNPVWSGNHGEKCKSRDVTYLRLDECFVRELSWDLWFRSAV